MPGTVIAWNPRHTIRCREKCHRPAGHFFALNLKSPSLFPLVLADRIERKKEQDPRALQRQSVALLRQGAGQGRKVPWVWAKAGVDFPFGQRTQGLGDLLPVPAQRGDVPGSRDGAGR